MRIRTVARLSLLLLLCMSFAAAAGPIPRLLHGERMAGEVVDADTGKPIAGAHVAFLWRSGIIPHGFTGHNSREICYHAAATVTDANGHFTVPAWKEWSNYDVRSAAPTVLVYVKGYRPLQRMTGRGSERRPVEHLDERYALPRFSGTTEERLNLLFWGLANQGCDYGGESQKSLYAMLKAIYEEARSVARSPTELQSLDSFATEAAYAALALDPSGPARDEDVRRFIEENLK
jgi:hypothetical protein